jgi:hypothetical protein
MRDETERDWTAYGGTTKRIRDNVTCDHERVKLLKAGDASALVSDKYKE